VLVEEAFEPRDAGGHVADRRRPVAERRRERGERVTRKQRDRAAHARDDSAGSARYDPLVMRISRAHFHVVEAMAALVAAQVCMRGLPFHRLGWLTGPVSRMPPDGPPASRSADPRARAIASALRRGAARLPFHSSCLARALAGRMMLARRRMPSTIVFGVAGGGELRAHAWLVAGDGMVCGGREAGAFTPIAAFRR
jgi:hypothetical protein